LKKNEFHVDQFALNVQLGYNLMLDAAGDIKRILNQQFHSTP